MIELTKLAGLILASLILTACASLNYPVFPGPAKKVVCQIVRENSNIGTYQCAIEGEYEIKSVNLF